MDYLSVERCVLEPARPCDCREKQENQELRTGIRNGGCLTLMVMFLLLYFKKSLIEEEESRAPICWLIPQMLAIAGVVPRRSQQQRIHSMVPVRVSGTQLFESSFSVFQRALYQKFESKQDQNSKLGILTGIVTIRPNVCPYSDYAARRIMYSYVIKNKAKQCGYLQALSTGQH